MRAAGGPCGSAVVLASGFCFLHDPTRAADRAAASVKGGRGKARIARAERLVPDAMRPVLRLLMDAMTETHAGDLDPKVATALAALAGAVARIYASAGIEAQLADLEAQIATLTRRGA